MNTAQTVILFGQKKSLAAQSAAITRGGALYVPRMAALAQLSDGTSPVTAVEQSIGRFTDVSGSGNHAIQATSTARAKYSARVNALQQTETWAAPWTSVANGGPAAPIVTGLQTDPNGTDKAVKLSFPAISVATSYTIFNQQFQSFAIYNQPHTHKISLRGEVGGEVIWIQYTPNGITYFRTQCALTTNWQEFTLELTTAASGALFYQIGVDLRDGSQSARPAQTIYAAFPTISLSDNRYQRVTTSSNYDTVGFPEYAAFDGIDDSVLSATGGGGSAGIFICAAVQITGGAGAIRGIWADRNANSGYVLRVNADNSFIMLAGNGTTLSGVSTGADTAAVGQKVICTCYDDGTNLAVQINNGTVFTVARPVVAAGTAGHTVGAFNGGGAQFFLGNIFGLAYMRNTAGTAAQREILKRYMAQLAQVAL